MRELIVEEKNNGKKVINFLQNKFNKVTSGTIYKALRNKDIRVNDVKINENVVLYTGDKITVYIKDELLYPTTSKIDIKSLIVYEDENIIVVNKPQELSVESEKNEDGLDKYLKEFYNNPKIEPCHRLDRNTRGLVIFAKNTISRDAMFQMIKERTVKKYYRALVYGCPKQKKATLTSYLFKDSKNSRVIISDIKKKGYQEIITKYNLIEKYADGTSLLEIELITGRTHQIRAHLAHIGLPIIGDGKYGINNINKQFGKKYQELESYKLIFEEAYAPLEYLKGKCIKIK